MATPYSKKFINCLSSGKETQNQYKGLRLQSISLDFNASTFDSQAAVAASLAGLATFILVVTIGWHIAIGIVSAIWFTILIYYLTTSWQKSLAKNIAKQIHEKNIWDKVEKSIKNFWDNTEISLSALLEEMRRQDDEYIESLKKEITFKERSASKPNEGRKKALAKSVGRIFARGIGGIGAAKAATGLVSAFGTASTGTAISSLSGAAATNATLAWLGGGTLAAGGLGIAGGAAVIAGIGIAGAYGTKKFYEHIWKN